VAQVEPTILEWARLTSGYSIEEAAKKAHATPERISAWESGTQTLSMAQLRQLADIYDRPLAAFYLASPPKEPKALHDFRHMAKGVPRPPSPKLIAEMRQARYRRTIALDVYDQLNDKPPRFTLRAGMNEDPITVAARIRDVTHLVDIQNRRTVGAYKALASLRVSVEQLGVLVFQMSEVEVEETRGFSLAESSLPVIVLNAKDAVTARHFTLMHELAHLMLHDGGICDLGDNDVEVYCNAVAGNALVPADLLRQAVAASVHRSGTTWNDDELEDLAHRFAVSPEAIMRRLLDAGLTTQDAYQSKRDEYLKRYADTAKKKTRVPVPQPVLVLSRAGLSFAQLVLEGYHQDRLTLSDVSNYLSVNLKHLPEIERQVTKRVLSLRTGV
jgi:Zn-dependent peptidase ImmA (M78 family)/transcriptional regulator with XRE-family HTH domain